MDNKYVEAKVDFEDMLKEGNWYKVIETGENSYLLVDDYGKPRWYGFGHFKAK